MSRGEKHQKSTINTLSQLFLNCRQTQQSQNNFRWGYFLISPIKHILIFRPEVTIHKFYSAWTIWPFPLYLHFFFFLHRALQGPAVPLTCDVPVSSAQQRWIHWFDRGAGQRKAVQGWGAPKREQNLLSWKGKTGNSSQERQGKVQSAPDATFLTSESWLMLFFPSQSWQIEIYYIHYTSIIHILLCWKGKISNQAMPLFQLKCNGLQK